MEFALVMPLLVLLLVGVIYFAMAFNLQQVLNTAAREGARRWAMNPGNGYPGCPLETPCAPEASSPFHDHVEPVMTRLVTNGGYEMSRLTIETSYGADWVKVSLAYRYSLPGTSFALSEINLHASSTFKIG
ncbi:MAG: pilus assembly protein [Deltaproteobacteria bacterium]|nr:pilus assembly protein [Deltaproteobacteria bacterium]